MRRSSFVSTVAAVRACQRVTDVAAMQKRGRMQEGMVADFTILDPLTVRDKTAHTTRTVPTIGILYVIVNGTTVVKDSGVLYEQSSLCDWVGCIPGDDDETRKTSQAEPPDGAARPLQVFPSLNDRLGKTIRFCSNAARELGSSGLH